MNMENTNCPDFSSHDQNAYDRWVEAHGKKPVDRGQWDEIDAAAQVEYLACEGH